MSAILTISPGMKGNHSYTCNAFFDVNGKETVLSETIHFVVVGRCPSICTLLLIWLPQYVSYMGCSRDKQTRNSIQILIFLGFHRIILNILRDPLEIHVKIICLLSYLQACYLLHNWSFLYATQRRTDRSERKNQNIVYNVLRHIWYLVFMGQSYISFAQSCGHFCILCADMYRGPLNMAALRSTNVEFACSRPDNGLIIWNIYRMSQRPDNPAEWPQHTLAFGGEFTREFTGTKYGLSLSYGVETLQIPNVTSEDVAVVECQGANSYWKRAQLVILGESTLGLPGVGVTKAPFFNFSESKIFDPTKVPVTFFESNSYLTGIPTAQLLRHLPNMNVIFNS